MNTTPKYLWVWLTIFALGLLYALLSPHGEHSSFNQEHALRVQQLHDARIDLEDAQRRIRKYETN